MWDCSGFISLKSMAGLGFGNLENCLVVEELSKVCVGVSVSFAASGLGNISNSSLWK